MMAFPCSKSLSVVSRLFLHKPFLRTQLPLAFNAATITSKEHRDTNVEKPKPWPYKKKRFTLFHWHVEGTMKRFDENTKFIVVEGNIGAGKTAFAKQLADTFDMKYLPEPDLSVDYITPYGYDLRLLDSIMPRSYKYCGIDTFYKNPYDHNVTRMQFRMLTHRYSAYIDAVAHLLNTGEGFVMDRCVFSDFVFLQAMYKCGYVRKEAMEYYMEIYKSVTEHLLRPHVVIYLDITPETALERIKKRNNEMEVNSKVLTLDYLSHIEHFYKQHYLKIMGKHAELLIYDWNNYGDTEVVIEDIEAIDFSRYHKYDEKMSDWRGKNDWEWGWLRRVYTNDKHLLMSYAAVYRPHISEVFHPPEEQEEYKKIMETVPGTKYRVGFNSDLGEKFLFKLGNAFDQNRFRV